MAWFDDGGAITGCLVAYDAIGASSLADSYVNEANPGTYNAAPGVAPSWASGTGWTFNGTTHYLTTGLVPPSVNMTVLVRYSGGVASGTGYLYGTFNSTYGQLLRYYTAGFIRYRNGSAPFDGSAFVSSAVVGVAGPKAYKNGVDEGITLGQEGVSPLAIYLGCLDNNGTPTAHAVSNIQAVAIYSGTLNAAEVAAITANMNALPNYVEGGKGFPVIAHYHRMIFGG